MWIHQFTEFGKYGSYLIQAPCTALVSDKVDCRRLGGRYTEGAARRVETLHRYIVQAPATDERDTYPAAENGAPGLGQHDLEFLRPVMGGAVELGG